MGGSRGLRHAEEEVLPLIYTFIYKGVKAVENTDNGYVNVKSRSGNYIAMTSDMKYAVAKFVAEVKGKPMSEQDAR